MNLNLPYSPDIIARFDGLYQYFSRRYPLEQTTLVLNDLEIMVFSIHDIDPLLDELINLGPENEQVTDERLPYWAEIWPSSIALSDFILASEPMGPDMRVIELGCGVGLAGLAASMKGARVLETDYQPDALRLTEMNWLHNVGRSPDVYLMDWRHPDIEGKFDRILASDVVYEKRFFQPLITLFHRLLREGGQVILSEPNRPIAQNFFEELSRQGFSHQRTDTPVNFREKCYQIGIYIIQKSP